MKRRLFNAGADARPEAPGDACSALSDARFVAVVWAIFHLVVVTPGAGLLLVFTWSFAALRETVGWGLFAPIWPWLDASSGGWLLVALLVLNACIYGGAVGLAFYLTATPDRPSNVCPACGYDLRGTPGSECPECGAAPGKRRESGG